MGYPDSPGYRYGRLYILWAVSGYLTTPLDTPCRAGLKLTREDVGEEEESQWVEVDRLQEERLGRATAEAMLGKITR
jgi:hypothetical protein